MIKKICNLSKIGDNYILVPRNNSNLESSCLISSLNHVGNHFDSNYIFDLRSEILNKCVNNSLHFYIKLLDNNMRELDLNFMSSVDDKALIYTFNRKKEKINNIKFLKYYPKINKFNIRKNRNIIYLGNSEKVNMRQVAYENTGCFSNFCSDNGGGYYGFNFKLSNMNIEPTYAVLLVAKKKMNFARNSNYYVNNRIESIINEEFDQAENSDYIIPSAPPMSNNRINSVPYNPEMEYNIPGYIEPTAPPAPPNIN